MLRVALCNQTFGQSLQSERISSALARRAFPKLAAAPVWRQQCGEQWDRGVRIDGGAFPEGFLPPALKGRGQLVAHPL
jgi:hypothetical protein